MPIPAPEARGGDALRAGLDRIRAEAEDAALRETCAHADLKAQLRSDDRPEALAYQPRPQGTGSSQGIMDWKVGCCVTVISLPLTVSVFVFPSLAASFSPPAHWQDHYQ